MPPDSSKYLYDIQEAIHLIQSFIAGLGFTAYQSNKQLKSAVERQLGIIGEALNQFTRLDPVRASRLSERARIIGMRNILIHAYGDVNDTLVWAAVTTRLSPLNDEITALLDEERHGA